jgi:hypothetical protein
MLYGYKDLLTICGLFSYGEGSGCRSVGLCGGFVIFGFVSVRLELFPIEFRICGADEKFTCRLLADGILVSALCHRERISFNEPVILRSIDVT